MAVELPSGRKVILLAALLTALASLAAIVAVGGWRALPSSLTAWVLLPSVAAAVLALRLPESVRSRAFAIVAVVPLLFGPAVYLMALTGRVDAILFRRVPIWQLVALGLVALGAVIAGYVSARSSRGGR